MSLEDLAKKHVQNLKDEEGSLSKYYESLTCKFEEIIKGFAKYESACDGKCPIGIDPEVKSHEIFFTGQRNLFKIYEKAIEKQIFYNEQIQDFLPTRAILVELNPSTKETIIFGVCNPLTLQWYIWDDIEDLPREWTNATMECKLGEILERFFG